MRTPNPGWGRYNIVLPLLMGGLKDPPSSGNFEETLTMGKGSLRTNKGTCEKKSYERGKLGTVPVVEGTTREKATWGGGGGRGELTRKKNGPGKRNQKHKGVRMEILGKKSEKPKAKGGGGGGKLLVFFFVGGGQQNPTKLTVCCENQKKGEKKKKKNVVWGKKKKNQRSKINVAKGGKTKKLNKECVREKTKFQRERREAKMFGKPLVGKKNKQTK